MKVLIFFILTLARISVAERAHIRNVIVPVEEEKGRITNGNTALPGQFPYQVGLSLRLNSFSSVWCGGSLIGKQWVLTAAHCTSSIQSVTVYLGATDRTLPELAFTVPINNIITHSDWNPSSIRNDISLIRIPSVKYNKRIRPIRLPSISCSYPTYEDNCAIASGWGKISDTATEVTDILQWGLMKVDSGEACKRFYPNYFTESNICVSTPDGVSTCNGDSGGPLVLDSSQPIQIGLSSFGAGDGCTKKYPVVFTRITSYLNWIKANTGIYYQRNRTFLNCGR